ncbi:hypothetical protein AB4254_03670 [Vibrio breoganii]
MYKFLLLAVVVVGLTACDGESSSNIKVPKLTPDEVKTLNALASGVNRDYDWKATSSSEDKADLDDSVTAVQFSTVKPFTIDRVDADFSTETHKIFTYEWQTFRLNDDGHFSTDGKTHKLEVGIPGLATTEDKLKTLLKSDNLNQEDQIRKAVYANFALPMTLGASELGAYRSFDALTTEPVAKNNYKPLCLYYKPNQSPRTDFSMLCTIPAKLSPFNKLTSISLEQQPGGPAYYKTDAGDTYQAYKFLQVIDVKDSTPNDVVLSADVLIHPGIGIISMELPVVNGINENGIKTTQTKWEWFNDNANILEQDY